AFQSAARLSSRWVGGHFFTVQGSHALPPQLGGCPLPRQPVRKAYNSQKVIMSTRPDPDALGFVLIDVARMLRSAFERRIATAGLGLSPGAARTHGRNATLAGSRRREVAAQMGIEPMAACHRSDRR